MTEPDTPEIPGAVAHGTRTTYVHWSCRCPACTTAATRYAASAHAARRTRAIPDTVPHGSNSTYVEAHRKARVRP